MQATRVDRARATVMALALAATGGTAVAAGPGRAEALAATCANCHGPDGRATGAMKPLAGRPADELLARLDDFRHGRVEASVMPQIVRGYTDEQLRLIAGWFAAREAVR